MNAVRTFLFIPEENSPPWRVHHDFGTRDVVVDVRMNELPYDSVPFHVTIVSTTEVVVSPGFYSMTDQEQIEWNDITVPCMVRVMG